jgi:hypothetical protein
LLHDAPAGKARDGKPKLISPYYKVTDVPLDILDEKSSDNLGPK